MTSSFMREMKTKSFIISSKDLTLLEIVNDFSDDIEMEYAKATFQAGKCINSNNIVLDINTSIRNLQQEV